MIILKIWLKRYLSERKDHEEALFVTTRGTPSNEYFSSEKHYKTGSKENGH